MVRGDWIVGDADGVVVVPGDRLHEVLEEGVERVKREAAMFEALRGGKNTIKLLRLDTTPVRFGEAE